MKKLILRAASPDIKLVLGIDPGLTGALAFYHYAQRQLFQVYDLPILVPPSRAYKGAKRFDIDRLSDLIALNATNTTTAILEHVGASPNQGVSSAFNFGEGFGLLRGLLKGHGIRTQLVRPGTWKVAMGLNRDKAYSIERANQLFPDNEWFTRRKHDGRAEAALLAYYGAQQFQQIQDLY